MISEFKVEALKSELEPVRFRVHGLELKVHQVLKIWVRMTVEGGQAAAGVHPGQSATISRV